MSDTSTHYAESYMVLERLETDARLLIEHVHPVTSPNERIALARKARKAVRYLNFLADRLELFDA